DVVVPEAAAVDARRGETANVARMHSVMNSLVGPVMLAGSDACLEIDDAAIHAGSIEFRQCITPDVIRFRRPRNRPVDALGQFYVGASIADVGFVQPGIVWMRQDLIDTAACHYVTAQEKANRVRHLHRANVLIAGHTRTNRRAAPASISFSRVNGPKSRCFY